MTRTVPLLLFVTLFVTPAVAQDVEFIRALERAQAGRPAEIHSTARIASPGEPGTELVVHGRVYAADGRTPLPNAIVFAYHTDRTGLYDRQGSPAHSWRLRGWARTDAEGRFEFRTIRPGPYPGSRIAAHIHFTIFSDGARYHAGELQFDDDELLTDRDRAESNRAGEFGHVQRVRREGAAEHVEFRARLNPANRF